MNSPMDQDSLNFLEEQKQKIAKQGEESMEDSLSDKDAEKAQQDQIKEVEAKLKTPPIKPTEEVVITPKATTIEEKRAKVKALKAKGRALKIEIAKQKALPLIEGKTSNQISYLRTGGLTAIEVSRLTNWMSTWSEKYQEKLFDKLRSSSSEEEIGLVLTKLCAEATLRGF